MYAFEKVDIREKSSCMAMRSSFLSRCMEIREMEVCSWLCGEKEVRLDGGEEEYGEASVGRHTERATVLLNRAAALGKGGRMGGEGSGQARERSKEGTPHGGRRARSGGNLRHEGRRWPHLAQWEMIRGDSAPVTDTVAHSLTPYMSSPPRFHWTIDLELEPPGTSAH